MSKTKRMMGGITSTALVLGMAGYGSGTEEYTYTEDIPDQPEDTSCSDWEWDDYDSNYFGLYIEYKYKVYIWEIISLSLYKW